MPIKFLNQLSFFNIFQFYTKFYNSKNLNSIKLNFIFFKTLF
ncbi:hypothetical protein CHAB381_1257 [Campylobacter hominis ATCC BAA-381]|uniref:Uncharacterized protein n=1 Tax=Campylobacter hominis (strain ATCC BAA-381 / DSM 21671 / CCUG 45161 / LMG 19568 / NCTC 13146 / CH001A) TaxID=360107 RepID=A7I2R7_CAMHC|nr:hypothetical protein CHAB381_1257 [Campylobacter hominis ATCC BAA-381]